MKKRNIIMGKTIGIDVDGTLCKEVCWTPEQCLKATPIKKNIEQCNKLYSRNIIVIYTARRDNLLEATVKFLKKHGVLYHAISNYKMPLNLLIDTDSMRPDEI